jgi:hypothetical protein
MHSEAPSFPVVAKPSSSTVPGQQGIAVLGGAWKCPPHHVAEIFREVVCGLEFLGVFRAVVFAILRRVTDNAAYREAAGIGDNYDVFSKYFTHSVHFPDTAASLTK